MVKLIAKRWQEVERYVSPVPTYGAAILLEMCNPNNNPELGPFDTDTPAVAPVSEMFAPIFIFLRLFVFELYRTHTRQTDRRTDWQDT